ncbi:hypothetical protein LY76DRAFT_491198, partial [Colletotrichum caudatum]
MASILRRAASGLYTVLAVSFLGVWSLIVLAGVGLTAVDADAGLLQLIALPSLLTYLVAKLVVAVSRQTSGPEARPTGGSGGSGSGNLATWLATAGHGSPHGALVLLLFSVTWLLHLARIVFALFLVVLMGGFMAFAATVDAAGKNGGGGGGETAGGQRGGIFDDADEGARQNMTAALARFEEQAGVVGIGDYLRGNPWVVFQAFAALWAAFGLLTAYVAAHAFGAARTVMTTPLEAWVRGG